MSEEIKCDTATIEINDQILEVETRIHESFKLIMYALKSEQQIEPLTVALTLYLMCKDICAKCNIEIDDLEDGLVESGDTH